MHLWSAVLCAEDERVCCIVNVVGCWTQLCTALCVKASTALAAVLQVLWPAVDIVCVLGADAVYCVCSLCVGWCADQLCL
jgi:hypothetical protein